MTPDIPGTPAGLEGRERRNLAVISLISLIVGIGILFLYHFIASMTWSSPVYFAAAILISVAITGFAYILENWIRKDDITKSKFSESVMWFSLTLFTLWQFLTTNEIIFKSVFGLLTFTFSTVFIIFLIKAISQTDFGRRIHPAMALAVSFIFFIALAFLVRSLDIMVIYLPLIMIFLYSIYVLQQYLLIDHTEEFTHLEQIDRNNLLAGFRIIFSNPNKHLRRSLVWIMVLIFIVQIPIVFFIKINGSFPDILANLPQISLVVYVTLLSIIAGFSVIYLRESNQRIDNILVRQILGLPDRDSNQQIINAFRRPFLGLAQMCIVFAIISLLGIVLGETVDFSILKSASMPSDLLWSIPLDGAVLRIIVLESLVLSFPPIFMYIYGLLNIIHEVLQNNA